MLFALFHSQILPILIQYAPPSHYKTRTRGNLAQSPRIDIKRHREHRSNIQLHMQMAPLGKCALSQEFHRLLFQPLEKRYSHWALPRCLPRETCLDNAAIVFLRGEKEKNPLEPRANRERKRESRCWPENRGFHMQIGGTNTRLANLFHVSSSPISRLANEKWSRRQSIRFAARLTSTCSSRSHFHQSLSLANH